MWSGNPVKLANKILTFWKVMEESHRSQQQGLELRQLYLSVATVHLSPRQCGCSASFLLHSLSFSSRFSYYFTRTWITWI